MPKPLRKKPIFFLNGNRQEISPAQSGMMLSEYLRYERGLTGTKVVCAEGDCGACSVLRLFPHGPSKSIYLPINSCITTVAQMDGSSLVTVDALGSEGLTPVQEAMVSCHGSQCGFCTPGFVVALTGLVERKLCSPVKKGQKLKAREAKNHLTGNLCRCTGYQPIVDAAVSVDVSKCISVLDRFYSKAQERELKTALLTSIQVEDESFSFFAPRTLKEATRYLAKNRDTKILAASTDLGVLHNKRKVLIRKALSLHLIPELYELRKLGASRISVGARVTLAELRYFLKDRIPEFARFLDLFASPQIKNVATLVGNVANASPVSDTSPFLLVTDGIAHVIGPKGKRAIRLDSFFLDYRKTAVRPGEVIVSIEFDVPKKNETVALYKVSQRKDLDISAVNAAFRVIWANPRKTQIKTIRLAMGGIAATPLRLIKTEAVLTGSKLNSETLARAVAALHSEMKPVSDLRASTAFRRVLVENLFLRFFREHAASEGLPS